VALREIASRVSKKINRASHFSIENSRRKMIYASAAILLLATLLPQLSVAYSPEALADQVKNLPGAEKLNIKFNQFSGYITIPGNSGDSKHLHYW
jgi:hypothetical protein